MFELFVILCVVFGAYIFIKFFAALFHVGFFIILLPLKILFAVLAVVAALFIIPFAIIPVILGLLVPFGIIALAVAGLIMLIK